MAPENPKTEHLESFDRTLGAECLDASWFAGPREAVEWMESWRGEYNKSRPHRALEERTENEFAG